MLQSFVVEHIALKDRQLGIGTIGFLNLDEFLEKLQTGFGKLEIMEHVHFTLHDTWMGLAISNCRVNLNERDVSRASVTTPAASFLDSTNTGEGANCCQTTSQWCHRCQLPLTLILQCPPPFGMFSVLSEDSIFSVALYSRSDVSQ